MTALFVGIDTGGTYTDLVLLQEGEIRVHKVLSTPDDPSQAILQGLADLGVAVGVGVGQVSLRPFVPPPLTCWSMARQSRPMPYSNTKACAPA